MKNKILPLYFYLIFNICNINLAHSQNINSGDCVGDARIFFTHLKALELTTRTSDVILKDSSNAHLVQGLKQFFKLELSNSEHTSFINSVFDNVNRLAQKAHKTGYYCDKEFESNYCSKNNLATSRYFKKRVYLCPGYFSRLSELQKVGVILHHWLHLWGYKNIAHRKEKFCHESFDLEAKSLIKQPDQYMQFIYYVGSKGKVLECFD